MEGLLITGLIVVAVIGLALSSYYRRQLKAYVELLNQQHQEFEHEKVRVAKLAKKRSGAVQWGKSIEAFVPFMTKFPIPAEDVTFLGMPIDYVGFTDTGKAEKCTVHFIEVKSGVSFLSEKQKNIKKAIQEGRVQWHEITVGANTVED
jgi:predicted Holliday junction resolvase-like endonuclease